MLQEAMKSNKLSPGDASKLAGKLSWGCSHLFRRFGRAMLRQCHVQHFFHWTVLYLCECVIIHRPLFDQKSRRDGKVGPELLRCLQWWSEMLKRNLAELRAWKEPVKRPVHLFCDAAGSPAHLGAVLFDGEQCLWTHMSPPENVLNNFRARQDNQIMGLELLAISLGFSTFAPWLRGRKVVVHCDNTGSEVLLVVCCFIGG